MGTAVAVPTWCIEWCVDYSAIFLGTVVVKVLVFCCFLNVFIESLHFWCIKNVNNS